MAASALALALAAFAASSSPAKALHALRSSLEPAQAEDEGALSPAVLEKIRGRAGLYADKSAHPEFAGTVLVTASNVAYSRILRNWRCHADKLGLDYVVAAFDPLIFQEAGERGILVGSVSNLTEAARFRKGHFNEMSCLKISVVKEIMRKTGLNVVFSDPDNVFREDPFSPSVSLGSKMRSGGYDYIYQQNHGRLNVPNASDVAAEVEEGNTGFYFVRAAKAKGVQSLFEATLGECRNHTNLDDQSLFWKALRTVRAGSGKRVYGADSFACASLCQKGPPCSAAKEDILDYCEMDPWNHATGWEIGSWKGNPKVVTYHSNYIGGGMDKKIGKLARFGFWDAACAGPSKP